MFNSLKKLPSYLSANDDTAALQGMLPNIVRALVTLFVLISPNMYNYFVPEVAGDVRWYAVTMTALIGLALLALHIFARGVSTVTIYKGPVPLYLAGFLAIMVAASLLWTISFYRTLFYGLHFIGYVGFFYLVYLLRSKQWYMTLVSVLAISVIFNSILGICHFLMIDDAAVRVFMDGTVWPLTAISEAWRNTDPVTPIINYFQYSAPPSGTFANKNLAASFLVVALPLMFWFFTVARTKTEYVLSSVALTLGSLFFLYTRSRGSWLAFAAAVFCFTVWVLIHRQVFLPVLKSAFTLPKRILLAAMVVVILVGAQAQSPLKGYHSVGESIGDQVTSITSMQPGELGTRKAYNINGIKMVLDRPLLGTGYSGFFAYYPAYHNVWVDTPPHGYKKEARPQRMHNDIAQMFVELGIPAGLAWLALFIFPIFAAWKIMRSTASNSEKVFTSILLLSAGGMTFNSMGDFPLQMPTGAMVLWLLWGMILGLYVMNCVPERKVLTTIHMHRGVYAIAAVVLLCAACIYADNMYARNKGAWHLKRSMASIKYGLINKNTLAEIQHSFDIYPYNSRTFEHLSLISTVYYMRNLQTELPPYEKIFEQLDMQIEEDPYGAGSLINRAALHLNRAQQLRQFNDRERAMEHIELAAKDAEVLQRVLPLHQDTHSTTGLVHLLRAGELHLQAMESEDEIEKAELLKKHADELQRSSRSYEKALAISPTDKVSRDGLNATKVRALQTGTFIEGLKGSRVTLPDGMLKR